MNEIIATAIPALMDVTSKKEIESLASWMIEEVLNDGKCLDLAERIAATEYLIKAIKADKRYVDYVREELAKNKGKYVYNGQNQKRLKLQRNMILVYAVMLNLKYWKKNLMLLKKG